MSDHPDAVTLLIDDHRRIEGMFAKYEAADNDDDRTVIAHDVIHDLIVHGEVEELLLYPKVAERVPGGEQLAEHSVHEHVEIKDADAAPPQGADVAAGQARRRRAGDLAGRPGARRDPLQE